MLWWAGDPRTGGVIAPPGGEHLLWVRPPAEPTRTSARHGRSRTALELRGWLDDIPTVVPWIDGRPLWPRNPYEKVNLDDQQERDHFATLMGWGRPQQADDIP